MRKLKKYQWILLALLFVGLVSSAGSYLSIKPLKVNSMGDTLVTKQKKYKNIEETKVMQGFSFNTLKETLFKDGKTPEKPWMYSNFDKKEYQNISKTDLQVTWFGHSSALIEMGGQLILTDPVFSTSVGPVKAVGTSRFHKSAPVTVEDLPKIDVVLISHDHYDHLDKKTIKALKDKTDKFVVPLGVKDYLLKWDVDPNTIVEMHWWQEENIAGLMFASVPARHFSGRGLFDRNNTLWTSWVVKSQSSSVFFSGDSGYHKDFKTIGEKYGPFDLGLMECGQYHKEWGLIHMMPEESVQASIDLKLKAALPIHWGAFSLSTHTWEEPIERFLKAAQEKNVNVVTPKILERALIDESYKSSEWWRDYK